MVGEMSAVVEIANRDWKLMSGRLDGGGEEHDGFRWWGSFTLYVIAGGEPLRRSCRS
jgi:hypothetical protein